MKTCLKNIRKICKQTLASIEQVENNCNGKMIDNDIIMSYKAGAFESILSEMRKMSNRLHSD